MNEYRLDDVLNTLKKLNYKIFDKPYMLNIVGIRSTEQPNKFDDTMFVFWKNNNGIIDYKQYPITTDTGTFWLKTPFDKRLGAGMMKAGQYIDAYKIGKHNGKYTALRQEKPVCAYRDNDRSSIFDYDEDSVKCGQYNMNIHKAGIKSEVVDNWSAGCQVFSKTSDFNDFMNKVKKHADLYGKDKFTYTLLDGRGKVT